MDENVIEHADEIPKVGELETLINSKDKTIKELREEEVNFKMENQTYKDQAEKIIELQERCTKSYLHFF